MPRLARLDVPGILHHVMGRGIERREIFSKLFKGMEIQGWPVLKIVRGRVIVKDLE
jgi:hypothetical protein